MNAVRIERSVMETLGGRIRETRRLQGKTMQQVANDTRLSVSLISQVERAESAPSMATLLKISGALRISLENLFAGY